MLSEFPTHGMDDFFNFDMFPGAPGPPSGPGSSSSRSSSNSPAPSFSHLPPTPPNPFDLAYDPTSTYFSFEDDFAKLEPVAIAPIAPTQPVFLGTFPPILEESSSESAGDSPHTIDPQLVETPATSAHSEFGDEEEEREEEEFLQDLDGEGEGADEDMDAIPLKVGGKGKFRKGTVQSGGVVKKTGGKEKKEKQPSGILTTTTMDPDDWRPTPEEYKKMSSREKRQLRNKISARNFRVRRKEYISTLEGDIAERDRLLDAIRTELRSTSDENRALRQEIDALKKALLEGNSADTPMLPPPAPLPAISAAAALASSGLKSAPPTPSKSPIVTPNLNKDLPTSPRLAGRGFWGGNMGLGGITPVHTTLVPDLSSVLSGKPRGASLQENINPMLNAQAHPEKTMEISMPATPFDSFTEMNPFTMKTLDAYRMHLWTRMAQQHVSQMRNSDSQTPSPTPNSPQLSGLASNLRPHYFSSRALSSVPSVLSGKNMANAYPTPPSPSPALHASVLGSSSGISSKPLEPMAQQAMLASMASQTLLGRLGSVFWDAFSGGSASTHAVDTDKVRRVLEGKAVLRVIDVDTPPAVASATPSSPQLAPIEKPAAVRPMHPMASGSSILDRTQKCDTSACLEKVFGKLHI